MSGAGQPVRRFRGVRVTIHPLEWQIWPIFVGFDQSASTSFVCLGPLVVRLDYSFVWPGDPK